MAVCRVVGMVCAVCVWGQLTVSARGTPARGAPTVRLEPLLLPPTTPPLTTRLRTTMPPPPPVTIALASSEVAQALETR